MSNLKAVILASGGLDSTVTASMAQADGCTLHLLTIAYGQRHAIEVARAVEIAKWLHAAEHKILELDLRIFGGSALTGAIDVPQHESLSSRPEGIPITYVPARNTIFLSLALAYAEVLQATRVYFGANVLDYSGYPDCRPEFLQAFMNVARLGTKMGVEGEQIEILTPLIEMSKAEIIKKGFDLDVPFHLTHSCYAPLENGRPCDHCESCLIRSEGFQSAGLKDPACM